MRRITATEARRAFARLYHEVAHSGEPVIVEHHGQGLVALVPAAEATSFEGKEQKPDSPPNLAMCIHALRENRRSLEEVGVRHAAIFGSVARGDATARSDVDVLVDFDRRDAIDLFGFAALRERLVELFGRDVDLVSRRALDAVRDRHMLDEAVSAF